MKKKNPRITIYPNERKGKIDPNIFGLHLEHIWNCVYPCVWVGRDSAIANTEGIRNQTVELLAALRPTVCKYPGGYFTDLYDWRDGVGSREKRPVRVCPTEPNREESNQFGTAEFVKFCRMIGAEPYLSAGTVATGPEVAAQWVEYCNLNGNTYWAKMRRKHGHREPFRVRYWAIGNEQYWFHSAQEYAQRYRTWAHFMYNTDPEIVLVASGLERRAEDYVRRRLSWGKKESWSETLLRITRSGQSLFAGDWNRPTENNLYSTHPYFSANPKCAGAKYYYQVLKELIKGLPEEIAATVGLLDKYRDDSPRPRLCFDEYGLLYDGCFSMAGNMTQPTPFSAALWLACFFQICGEHPNEVAMATLPGTINMEHALLLAEKERVITTPSYYIFQLYRQHGGAEPLATSLEGCSTNRPLSRPALWPLATISPDGRTATLSVINLDFERDLAATINFSGAHIRSASGMLLATTDINAANTFTAPDRIKPEIIKVRLTGNQVFGEFPAHSVTVFNVELAP